MNKNKPETTHFGFQTIPWDEKEQKVREVFHSVAENYDVMNDVMSLGIHRLWKKLTVALSHVRSGQTVLDCAGGSGDLTSLLCQQVGPTGRVVLADINHAMLKVGQNRLIDEGYFRTIDVIEADAQALPFVDNLFHVITMGFGLRNVTDKEKALRALYRVCKPGGRVLILEFSKPEHTFIQKCYDWYSFHILPKMGELVANDKSSYQYLVESIRMHPDADTLKHMIENAGFEDCHYHRWNGGIVALHMAYKY